MQAYDGFAQGSRDKALVRLEQVETWDEKENKDHYQAAILEQIPYILDETGDASEAKAYLRRPLDMYHKWGVATKASELQSALQL